LECWINDFAGKATQFVSLCNALALINRQKETIEQLKTALFKCGEEMATARAEAVKEFAETIKANQRVLFNYIYSRKGFTEIVDNLVKEFTEGG
jgi:recombinational DNA repair ATPase RecF